jgi:hypothetical protein
MSFLSHFCLKKRMDIAICHLKIQKNAYARTVSQSSPAAATVGITKKNPQQK